MTEASIVAAAGLASGIISGGIGLYVRASMAELRAEFALMEQSLFLKLDERYVRKDVCAVVHRKGGD